MDYPVLIKSAYDHIDRDDVAKGVMVCLRVSRNLKDYFNAALFLRELYPDVSQLKRAFREDTNKLTEKERISLWERTQELWIAERTLDLNVNLDDPSKNVFVLGVGELDPEIDQIEKSIQDMVVPGGMGAFDTAAFADRYNARKASLRLQIAAVQAIKDRIKTRCLNYLIQLERQMETQSKSEAFLQSLQNDVNNYFKAHSEDVYTKLEKATQLVDSHDPEDMALLLTLVRKAIKSAADYFYPPSSNTVVCSDGKGRCMGDEQYLNRLQEFLSSTFAKSSSSGLLLAECEHLMAVARKLNSAASKGVHTDVTALEAKQGLVCLYMFLFNLISALRA